MLGVHLELVKLFSALFSSNGAVVYLGLLFMANEAPKILQYFVPALGTAPKWCSYLETITDELEETDQPAGTTFIVRLTKDYFFSYIPRFCSCTFVIVYLSNYFSVYDDYKFVTAKELEDLDLDVSVLKRMNMLRAYMHGYFIDARLYVKSKAVKQQFDFEKFKEKKVTNCRLTYVQL